MNRNVCKLIGKILLAALPLVVFAMITLCFPMRLFDKEYPMWQWQKDVLTDESTGADVVFLGDSLIQSGVMPTLWGDDALSLALGGATPIEMRYSLEVYLANHDAPKLIIMGSGITITWNRTASGRGTPTFTICRLASSSA
jgi:hypothetical protein